MDGESRRFQTAHYRQQRERYLQTRMMTNNQVLAPNRQLLSTRRRSLPAVLVAPFALLTLAGMFDLAFLVTGVGFLTQVSFALIPAGIVGSLLAVAVGGYDWLATSRGSRVRSVGVWFAVGTVLVVTIFGWSWVARIGTAADDGGVGVVLGVIGATVAVLSGLLLADYLERLASLKTPQPTLEPVERLADAVWAEESVEPRQVAHA